MQLEMSASEIDTNKTKTAMVKTFQQSYNTDPRMGTYVPQQRSKKNRNDWKPLRSNAHLYKSASRHSKSTPNSPTHSHLLHTSTGWNVDYDQVLSKTSFSSLCTFYAEKIGFIFVSVSVSAWPDSNREMQFTPSAQWSFADLPIKAKQSLKGHVFTNKCTIATMFGTSDHTIAYVCLSLHWTC